MGSPARGQGSNCKLRLLLTLHKELERKDLQSILEMLVDLHDGGLIAASVTVVGCCTCKLM
jgi:hypothetical protein